MVKNITREEVLEHQTAGFATFPDVKFNEEQRAEKNREE
jgi:hypothetical protein